MDIHIHEAAATANTALFERLDQLETLTKQMAGVVNALIEQSAALAEKIETLSPSVPGESPVIPTNHGVVEKNITPPKEKARS